MKPLLLTGILAVSLSGATAAHAASQTVVTFEDADPGVLADGYGGISGWAAAGVVFHGSGDGVGAHLFYGPSEGELRFDSGPVVFEGTFYKSYATGADPNTLSFSLFYQGQLVHETLDPHFPLSLEWLPSGYAGLVDRIYFYGGGEGFAVDNLTYSAVPVPVPGAIGLFGSALAGLMLLWKRRPA